MALFDSLIPRKNGLPGQLSTMLFLVINPELLLGEPMNSKRSAVLFLSAVALFNPIVLGQSIPVEFEADVVVYGATSGGISAAAAAAREGRSVLLVEHMSYLGGLLGSGFSMYEDMPFRETLGGLTGWWYDRTSEYQGAQNRIREYQALAEKMLSSYADKIQILTEHRVCSVTKENDRIVSITLEHAQVDEYGIPAARPTSDKTVVARGLVFIDASYEGDVMAMAKVSYTVGRESAAQYGESLAGVTGVHRFPGISPYNIENDPKSGLLPFIDPKPLGKLGDASEKVNGYNFKFFWNKSGGGRPMSSPDSTAPFYDPVNKLYQRIKGAGYQVTWPMKNDDRRQPFTGTIPGIQAGYPDGDWAERSGIWREHIEHGRRLTALTGNKVNMDVERAPDTNGWPPQLYVRTARRLIGEYVLTQKDIQLQTKIPGSIGLGFYAIDMHPTRMLVLDDGTLATEGELLMLVSPGPWGLPYSFITPKRKECTNLLVPVCFSASHVAHAATRLEAQYMIIGESAGVAAAQAIDEGKAVQEIDVKRLQKRLLEHGQVLEWDGKGYGRYRSSVGQGWPTHLLYRWQNHPEEYTKFMPKPRRDIPIFMDDIHAERVGKWEELSKHRFFINQGYLQDNGTDKGKKSVIFKPIIRRSGYYEVRIAYPPRPENSKRVPVLIHHADGVDTVHVDQTRKLRNGLFDSVGTFRFEADGQSTVTVQTQGTEDGLVLVDAMQFVPAWQQTDIEIGVGGESKGAISPKPTVANVAYDKHKLTQFDFWQAKGEGPRPLLIFIHGGGWYSGDKSIITPKVIPDLKVFLDKGVSVASVNYRKSPNAPLPIPVHDAAYAVQFIRHHAQKWNIDKNNIALSGGSAGGCTSMWILCHDDLADPESDDPVKHESTRVNGAAVVGGQVSIDPKVIEDWLGPQVLQHQMIYKAVGEKSSKKAILNYKKHEARYKEFSPYNHMSGDDPPLFMFFGNDMTLPSKDSGHGIHHPVYGVKMKEKADQLGVECHLQIQGVSEAKYANTEQFLLDLLLKR